MRPLCFLDRFMERLVHFQPPCKECVRISCASPTADTLSYARLVMMMDVLKSILKWNAFNAYTLLNVWDIHGPEFPLSVVSPRSPDFVYSVSENITQIIFFLCTLNQKRMKESHSFLSLVHENLHIPETILWTPLTTNNAFASPWGAGIPSWSAACSALTSRVFQNRVDILVDSKATNSYGHQFVIYSLMYEYEFNTPVILRIGEVRTLQSCTDILKDYTVNHLRWYFLSQEHYSDNVHYDEEDLVHAKNAFEYISQFCQFSETREYCNYPDPNSSTEKFFEKMTELRKNVDVSLQSDMNTCNALRDITNFVDYVNEKSVEMDNEMLKTTIRCVRHYMELLGFEMQEQLEEIDKDLKMDGQMITRKIILPDDFVSSKPVVSGVRRFSRTLSDWLMLRTPNKRQN